jgi:hypothetical protein
MSRNAPKSIRISKSKSSRYGNGYGTGLGWRVDSCGDLLHDLLCGLEAVGDAELDRAHLAEIDAGFANPVVTTNRLVGDAFEFIGGHEVMHGADGGFHDAAGRAEDLGRCRVAAHPGVVEGQRLKIGEPDAFALEQASAFAGRQHDIDVGLAVALHLRAIDLFFIGRARHDRDHSNLAREHAELVGEIDPSQELRLSKR